MLYNYPNPNPNYSPEKHSQCITMLKYKLVYLFNGKEFLNSEKRFEILSSRRIRIMGHLTPYSLQF